MNIDTRSSKSIIWPNHQSTLTVHQHQPHTAERKLISRVLSLNLANYSLFMENETNAESHYPKGNSEQDLKLLSTASGSRANRCLFGHFTERWRRRPTSFRETVRVSPRLSVNSFENDHLCELFVKVIDYLGAYSCHRRGKRNGPNIVPSRNLSSLWLWRKTLPKRKIMQMIHKISSYWW